MQEGLVGRGLLHLGLLSGPLVGLPPAAFSMLSTLLRQGCGYLRQETQGGPNLRLPRKCPH